MRKVDSWLRKSVFYSWFLRPVSLLCVSSVSHRLYRKLFTPHSIMCLASTACLPHYIIYFLFFTFLNIIEKLCWWIPRQQTKRSHLYCHEKQSRYWKYLFPVAGGDESSSVSASCSSHSTYFLTCSYGKCDIYKRDHLFAWALLLGCCVT